ncbi:MAG: chemotaxis protein CheX [Magnetococcales bacterium]|nr:chemotaxis protein CheX [Magnetococcales bacterium]
MADPLEHRRILLDALQGVTLQILESESWGTVTCDAVKVLPSFQLTREVCGVVHILGALHGLVAVMATQRTVAAIIGTITGSQTRELTQEDILDGIAELANMVCGNMKSRAQIGNLAITPPVAIMGTEFIAQWKTVLPVHQLTFHMRDHTLVVLASV